MRFQQFFSKTHLVYIDSGTESPKQLILLVHCILLSTEVLRMKILVVVLWLLFYVYNQAPSWLPTMWATAAPRCPSGARVTAVGTSGRAVSVSCTCSKTIYVCVSSVFGRLCNAPSGLLVHSKWQILETVGKINWLAGNETSATKRKDGNPAPVKRTGEANAQQTNQVIDTAEPHYQSKRAGKSNKDRK